MKKLILGLFRLLLLVLSVLAGFLLVKKFKSKEFFLEEDLLDEEEGIDEFTEEEIIEQIKTPKAEKPVKKTNSDSRLSARQRDVLAIIEKEKVVEMKALQKRIKGVTERTLRRDLTQIQKIGAIKKIGNTKSVKYQLITK